MTTNEMILAKADALAQLVRSKYIDEWMEVVQMPVQRPSYPVPGGGLPPMGPYVDLDKVEADAENLAATIRPAFEWFTQADPVRVGVMLDSLRHVVGSLNFTTEDPALGYIDSVRTYVAGWYGQAADAFNLNFLAPLPAVRHNQVGLAGELAKVLEGYQTLLLESRSKILEIGDQAMAALNDLPGGGLSLAVVLSIASAVVGVLGTAFSGGSTFTVTLAVLGGGLSVGAQVASETEVGGSSVERVVGSVHEAIRLLKQDMANAETILADVLRYDADLLAAELARARARVVNELVLLRPNVVDVIQGTDVDFELSTDGSSR